MNAWEQHFDEVHAVIEKNRELTETKFRECEAYVETKLKKQYPDCGIVYTNHEESIKAGYFTVWVECGSITHKFLKLEDCGIEPLQLYDFPVRPDAY